jgi:HEPN domain-containing protein
MPRETAASARRWLEFAHADLAHARGPLPPGGRLELLCYHAQQAVEKALKSALIAHGIEFPRTHSIDRLVDALPDALIPEVRAVDAVILTVYATASRYPGTDEPVTEDDHAEAIAIAERVIKWAERIIE